MEFSIFSPICDNRPWKLKLWCMFASIGINALVLVAFLLAFEISAARRASERVMADLRREMSMYRTVMILPAQPELSALRTPSSLPIRSPLHRKRSELKPLAVPDPRLLQRLDPQLASFIKDNPKIESIFTRELVRDVDSKRLDYSKLLVKSQIEASFGIDTEGQLTKPKIVHSSSVPSLDHLALELVQLLDKYKLLGMLAGIDRVSVGIIVGEEVEITLKADIRLPATEEEVEKRIRAGLALVRFALQKEEAAYFLNDINVSNSQGRVVLSKNFDKRSLIDFLKRYYQPHTSE